MTSPLRWSGAVSMVSKQRMLLILVLAAGSPYGSAVTPLGATASGGPERKIALKANSKPAGGLLQTEVLPEKLHLNSTELEQVTAPGQNLSAAPSRATSALQAVVALVHPALAASGAVTPRTPMQLVEAGLEGRETAEHAEGGSIVMGLLLLLLGLPIHWLNEDRSARMNALITRGKEDCISVDAQAADPKNRGKLVHIQGKTHSVMPVCDFQFQDAVIKGCLKLQSNVEVLEWVQTTHSWNDGRERRSQPRFHTEWTTSHHDSSRFRKPSPENPRPPSALVLGTTTTCSTIVEIGGFTLPQDMVNHFVRYEPAMPLLPEVVSAFGLMFHANVQDGYYYARPSMPAPIFSAQQPRVDLLTQHQVGDLRVRFLYVPETVATVVAVQCLKGGVETFIPYRVVPRGPCTSDYQERLKLIEEGDKTLKEVRGERLTACCGTSSGVATCCCCPCQTITACCMQEVVTEEIYYISDRLEPIEKPFQRVVHRNPIRVWNFRIIALAITYGGVALISRPVWDFAGTWPGLELYGSYAGLVLCVIVTLACWAAVVVASYACYRPTTALQCLFISAALIALPLMMGASGHSRG